MECLKNCCKNLTRTDVRALETEVIKLKVPPNKAITSGVEFDKGQRGVTEDYLLSKLPPNGKEVPFVLPTIKTSFVQPRGSHNPSLQSGMQSSVRSTYAERKAELLGSGHFTYSPESNFHQGQMVEYISPGSSRRDTVKNRLCSPLTPGWTLQPDGQHRLCTSMLDLSNAYSHLQRFDSVSSIRSSASSMMGSTDSCLDSITMSAEEREWGKVCVQMSYQDALEQVWITLVQCSDLNLPLDGAEQQKVGFKGIITLPKPIQFKSSVKDYSQDVSFIETFVFALRLQELRCSALVLRLQTHVPKKRTVAECVLSLRQLGPLQTLHWLDLSAPSKSSVCHAELHLTTCFQPVNGRIQLQIIAGQNLPASSSPITQAFFVKAEMHQMGQVLMKKKTRVMKPVGGQCQWAELFHFQLAAFDNACSLLVKLYSRSSVRRKQCLGQVQLGYDSPIPEAVEQWKDMMAHPEKMVTAWHRLNAP